MGRWQDDSLSPHELPEAIPSMEKISPQLNTRPRHDTDSESDYFQSFLRSPTRTAYPDPADFAKLPTGLSPATRDQVTTTIETQHNQASEPDKAVDIQSPILKGVKWPGMSLFDSASLEAQRRRNQKKDESIVEQMEFNSVAVEQIERIYWPDGALKKERLITGNVESSPSRSPTPPPAPSKRQRTKGNKSVLTDLSTNHPKLGRKPRQRKSIGVPAKQASDLQTLSEKALARLDPAQASHPRNPHLGYDPADEEECERRLTFGDWKTGRRRAFEIFGDEVCEQDARPNNSQTNDDLVSRTLHGHHHVLHSHGPNLPVPRTPLSSIQTSTGDKVGAQLDNLPWDSQYHAFSKASLPPVPEDRENIEPVFETEGQVDDGIDQTFHQRVTQRYFSVTGDQPPQFFNRMPPQMDFGGLAEPRYYGSTLNPLNLYIRQQIRPQSQTHCHLSTPVTRLVTSRSSGQASSATA